MPAENGQPENIATAVTEVSERMTLLLHDEIELAKAEMVEKASLIARGAAAVAVGAVFGVFAIVFLLLTVAWGLNSALGSVWAGFAIVFVVLVIAAVSAFPFARSKFKVGPPTPDMAIDEAKRIRAIDIKNLGAYERQRWQVASGNVFVQLSVFSACRFAHTANTATMPVQSLPLKEESVRRLQVVRSYELHVPHRQRIGRPGYGNPEATITVARALLRLLLGFELFLERHDHDPQRLGDLQGGGRRPRCADYRRDRDQDVLDLLERNAGVHRSANVHQI
ncbi:MAG TPA: phage holin family protein [Gemmatimonadaceae bacterium]